jgi:hypothetical protein
MHAGNACQVPRLPNIARYAQKMTLSYFEERLQNGGAKYGISLQMLRPAFGGILQAISSSGFFRTYTDHSLKHCDQMLAILAWLLPNNVKEGLTDIECGLLVLAVYLHDLGMLATQKEFETRQSNDDFVRYQQQYTQAFDTASTLSADHPSLDHFLFEEYIRQTHSQRIFDWLISDHNTLPQAKHLRGLLYQTSDTFRHYLGVICRSHHLNNLHDKGLYPVDCQFGNDPTERANIQFVAICLRLADILHMSRDRTPSIQFQLISPRNPISAREWAKQLDVSGVGISISDPAEVRVHAVCRTPQIYFYLKDFIKICDEELLKCRGWLEANPPAVFNRYNLAVRHVSDFGLRVYGFIAERFELQLDQRRVIDLLMGHSLYGDSKVAIRELVQNALDAVRVRRLEDPTLKPSISIQLNEDNTVLEITDNGIGMDLEVIRNHFLKIGDSYYRSPEFRRRCPAYTPISQFGIGFLSSFMIADRVTVLTRTRAETAATLVLQLEDIYDLFAVREITRNDKEGRSVENGGTSVILHLRKDVDLGDLFEDVRRWLVFLEFPITVKVGSGSPKEVWGIKGTTSAEIAADIAHRVEDDNTQYLPIQINRDSVNVVILWPGGKLGDIPLLDPAGRYLLPLTARFSHWHDEIRSSRRRAEESLIRKVANGGIFLASEIPGLTIAEWPIIHYVVDCRGELRFTPLVSRGGIAVDESSIKILNLFVECLADFFTENIKQLLKTGVSKYFCSYYLASAFALLLFKGRETDRTQERSVSTSIAVQNAYRVPFLLFKHGSELLLRSWKDHAGQPIVIGRNVYNDLLRSVAVGVVDFPLPKEVIESLPEHFLLTMGAEEVIEQMILGSSYRPSAVQYHEPSRGIFVRWETNAKPDSFGGIYLPDFPEELNNVTAIRLPMASCLNLKDLFVKGVIALANQAIGKAADSQLFGRSRLKMEEEYIDILFRVTRMSREFEGERDRLHRRLREVFLEITPATVEVPDDLIDLCIDTRIIGHDLWAFGNRAR